MAILRKLHGKYGDGREKLCPAYYISPIIPGYDNERIKCAWTVMALHITAPRLCRESFCSTSVNTKQCGLHWGYPATTLPLCLVAYKIQGQRRHNVLDNLGQSQNPPPCALGLHLLISPKLGPSAVLSADCPSGAAS